jgi:hypothetical protein
MTKLTSSFSAVLAVAAIGLTLAVASGISGGDAAGPDASQAVGAAEASKSARKYHPGHYVSLNRFDGTTDMLGSLVPGIVGVQKRYYWKTLEPTLSNYDFSEIETDLKTLAERHMQLVVFIEDKTFKGENPLPPYLQEKYSLNNIKSGHTAIRWDPYVVERMKALISALGKRFDSDANFEGVALQESALSLDDKAMGGHGYSASKYSDALTDVLLSAAEAMPHSRVFWYMNFIPGGQSYIADIATRIAPAGVAMGGPDILPDQGSLKARVYPFYQQFNGKMVLFNSMQNDSYAHLHSGRSSPSKYWQMEELFRFARDELHVNYIFWNRKSWKKPPDSYSWDDAVRVIGANPSFNQPQPAGEQS